MNKLLLSASALAIGMFAASQAMADCNGLYLAARGGIVKHKYESSNHAGDGNSSNHFNKEKFMASGALGFRYNYFRTELEYVWRAKNKQNFSEDGGAITSGYDFKSESYMLNGYFDLAPYSWLTPYVGAGIGMTKMKYNDKGTIIDGEPVGDGFSSSKTNFTWSVGGGLSVKVTNRFNVDAGYRYYDMGKIKGYTGSEKNDITAQEVYGGIRYVF
jgi:opacity protein-like surface antigen